MHHEVANLTIAEDNAENIDDIIEQVAEASEGNSSDAVQEDIDLPQCKIKRIYSCNRCKYYTQNPRAYLIHIRDIHEEKLKIFDCPHCVYASRHCQKLLRHVKMVHKTESLEKSRVKPATSDDMLELVEQVFENSSDDETATGYNQQRKQHFFSCAKCNYVTHIRSRYKKHVKYHSMPMIKCALCDFRTPYKWNLDRHMKNHGGIGAFCCSMCNFTADIKQSLTVHEINHHTPPVGYIQTNRRRNRVGGSDLHSALPNQEERTVDSKMENLVVEQSRSMEENSNYSMQSIEQGPEELQRMDDTTIQELTVDKQNKKLSRPIPNLIPILPSTSSTVKNNTLNENTSQQSAKSNTTDNRNEEVLVTSYDNKLNVSDRVNNNNKSTTGSPLRSFKKKNESFFDKLKERLLHETGEEGTLTCKSCGFESKCLSEHSVHEKNCMATINKTSHHSSHGSTRCQNCRHRCKSSADLILHLKTCQAANTNNIECNNVEENINDESFQQPHPMENRVFVWNTLLNPNEDKLMAPLSININEDQTVDYSNSRYTPEISETETNNLSPSSGKRVFKCPHCKFWATTASRFHVHIVGHLNKKPFECSLCSYKSNWRWDITKHIRLKSVRDPEHNNAKVLMTDETGRRNYTKYNKYLASLSPNDEMDSSTEAGSSGNTKGIETIVCIDDEDDDVSQKSLHIDIPNETQSNDGQETSSTTATDSKVKKTVWKCKKCNYKHASKEMLLEHVREHSKKNSENDGRRGQSSSKETEQTVAYRCGHCHQLSNWKHVIQRHCRLKHNGVIKVEQAEKFKIDEQPVIDITMEEVATCPKCPFTTSSKSEFQNHLQQHTPSQQSVFKCYFCQYFVKNEADLLQHLSLHGISDPESYVYKTLGKKNIELSPAEHPPVKRHRCSECPYETNSRSQFIYHEQFHKLPANSPYKCQICNYSVTKRHLLHQHMKVHGMKDKKEHTDTANYAGREPQPVTYTESLDAIPYVWVLAKNEFHKMYRCRYCSYVNSQLSKIPNHEKMHCIDIEDDNIIFKCLECKYTCDDAPGLTEHCKIHGEIYGRIYCAVDPMISDDNQIAKLRVVYDEEQRVLAEASNRKTEHDSDEIEKNVESNKPIYFCQKCPARFFVDRDWNIHNKFHELKFPLKCRYCSYTVPQDSQLAVHNYVHTDDYRSKTKMLQLIHETHSDYQQPKTIAIRGTSLLEVLWVVENKPEKNDSSVMKPAVPNVVKSNPKPYACKICPARFCKSGALNYHNNLHGSNAAYKCRKCSFAVNTLSKLSKHQRIHDKDRSASHSTDYDSNSEEPYNNVPLSGTDLFQRKTEAQKRVLNDKVIAKPNDYFPPILQADPQFGYLMHGNPDFVYPTYMKNGRQKEKRYKCHKCPSAFEKREQYKVHLSLHGSKQRYKCDICDYSVKYYANYVQHMRKHQMNSEAQAERKKNVSESSDQHIETESLSSLKLAIKTMPKPSSKSDFQQYSIGDQQTLLLLQRKRASVEEEKESEAQPTKLRKLLSCLYCPYTNNRNDALAQHEQNHECVSSIKRNCECPYCDYSTNQINYLNDHIKKHFTFVKERQPEFYFHPQDLKFTVRPLDNDKTNIQEIKIAESDKEKDKIKSNENVKFVDLTSFD